LDEKLFKALARSAERRRRVFHVQALVNTAWAFARLKVLNDKLFMVLARETELRGEQVRFAAACPHGMGKPNGFRRPAYQ